MPHLHDNIRFLDRDMTVWNSDGIGRHVNERVLQVKRNGEWLDVEHVTASYDNDGVEITDDNSGG